MGFMSNIEMMCKARRLKISVDYWVHSFSIILDVGVFWESNKVDLLVEGG
jgi:hypothetical protein